MRKKGAALSYILMIFEMLSSIFFTPFLIRSFGQAEYGIYSLVASITAYLTLLDLGVGNAIVRYMARFRVLNDEKKQKNLLTVTILFYAVIGILAIMIGTALNKNLKLLFGKGLTDEQILRAKEMLNITMLNVAVTLILAPFNKTIIAYEKFVFQKLSDILKIIVRVGICTVVLICGGKGVAIVNVNFLLTLIFGAVSVFYVFYKLKIYPSLKEVDFSFIKEIVVYSSFIFLQMIATQINSMADQILIGSFVEASAVILGIYAVGAQINQYFQSIASSINGVLMPGVVSMVEKGATSEQLLDEMVRIGRILFMLLGIIWGVFVTVGDRFIVLWAGEKNYQAYYVACLLITPMVMNLVQSIGTQILWAKNKHKIQAYLKLMVVIMNVFLTIVLIKWNPLIGACIGTAISVFLGDVVVMNIVFSKDIGISMKKYYKGLFKGILLDILITMLFGFLLKNIIPFSGWFGFLILCFLMMLCYCVLIWFRGMNSYEKNLVTSVVHKVLKLKK